jgi:hypothetical protein
MEGKKVVKQSVPKDATKSRSPVASAAAKQQPGP